MEPPQLARIYECGQGTYARLGGPCFIDIPDRVPLNGDITELAPLFLAGSEMTVNIHFPNEEIPGTITID